MLQRQLRVHRTCGCPKLHWEGWMIGSVDPSSSVWRAGGRGGPPFRRGHGAAPHPHRGRKNTLGAYSFSDNAQTLGRRVKTAPLDSAQGRQEMASEARRERQEIPTLIHLTPLALASLHRTHTHVQEPELLQIGQQTLRGIQQKLCINKGYIIGWTPSLVQQIIQNSGHQRDDGVLCKESCLSVPAHFGPYASSGPCCVRCAPQRAARLRC